MQHWSCSLQRRATALCCPALRGAICSRLVRLPQSRANTPASCAGSLQPLSPLDHRCSTAAEPDLDTKCERLLRRHFNLPLDFTAEQAIPALGKWGLVVRQADGQLHAQPLPAALAALDAVWDGIYDFPAATSTATSAGKDACAGRAAGAAGHAAASVGMNGAGSAGGGVAAEQTAIGECGDEDGWQLAAVGGISADGVQPDQAGLEGQQRHPAGAWEAAPLQQTESCPEPGGWEQAGDMDAAELESGSVGTSMLEAAAALQGGAADGWLAGVAAVEAGSAGADGGSEAGVAAGEIHMQASALDGEPGAGWEQAAAKAEREGAAAVPTGLPQTEAGAAGTADAADTAERLSTEESSLTLSSSSSSSSLEFVSLRSAPAWRGPARRCGVAPAAAAAPIDPGSSPTRDRGCVAASPLKYSPSARLSPRQLRWLGHRGR